MLTIAEIIEFNKLVLSNRQEINFIIQMKSQMQIELKNQLTTDEITDLHFNKNYEKVIVKMIHIAKSNLSSLDGNKKQVYGITMASATILKELGYSEFVSNDGLAKFANKLGESIVFNNAEVYCQASKTGLKTRNQYYLQVLKQMVDSWKNDIAFQSMNFEEIISFIVSSSHKAVMDSNWDEYGLDGVSWFIGNYSEMVTQARIEYRNDYDRLFIAAFNCYFKNTNPMDSFDQALISTKM